MVKKKWLKLGSILKWMIMKKLCIIIYGGYYFGNGRVVFFRLIFLYLMIINFG